MTSRHSELTDSPVRSYGTDDRVIESGGGSLPFRAGDMYHIQLVKVGRLLQAITIMRPVASIHERRKTCAVPYSVQVLDHLRDRKLTEPSTRGAYGFKGSCIRLEAIEVLDSFAVGSGRHGSAQEGRKGEDMYREMARR